MQTLRQMVDGNSIYAYGTSEGVKKAWDSRGRSSEEKTSERNHEIARFNPEQMSLFGPRHVAELQQLQRSRQLAAKQLADQKRRQREADAHNNYLDERSGAKDFNAQGNEDEIDVERGSDGPGH